MEEKENTRGGKREGAGRKKKIVKNVTFGAEQDIVEFLVTYEGNKNVLINEAIRQYVKLKKNDEV